MAENDISIELPSHLIEDLATALARAFVAALRREQNGDARTIVPKFASLADRQFLTDGRPYLTTVQAAIFVGYEPTTGGSTDRAMHCFHTWACKRKVKPLPGRSGLYRRSDLIEAVERRRGASDAGLREMEELARRHANGTIPRKLGMRPKGLEARGD